MPHENHKFWSTQPARIGTNNATIEIPSKIISTPYLLPNGFYFVTLTINDLPQIYELLFRSYVEDASNAYRLMYSLEFLRWQIDNPSHKKEYLLGIRRKNGNEDIDCSKNTNERVQGGICDVNNKNTDGNKCKMGCKDTENDKLYGFALGREHTLSLRGVKKRILSVNYLCIVKELRGKRLAPVIIKELTRRANMNGIFHALFTGGIELPFKVSSAQYFHKLINTKKLVKMGYCGTGYLGMGEKSLGTMRKGTRSMEEKDIEKVFNMFKTECVQFELYEDMDINEFRHNFLERSGVVYTFVHEEEEGIIDFGMFYILNSYVIPFDAQIKTSYLGYYAGRNKVEMVQDLIVFSKEIGCDIFNCLNLMGNAMFFDKLGFYSGDGILNYYLFNWETSPIDKHKIHFLLP